MLCNYFHVEGVEDGVKYEQLIKGYVCRRCRRYRKHVLTHNFLNIQWIFNPEKVLES